jgi:ABC-type Fe3+-siderophore transport system permease subunit
MHGSALIFFFLFVVVLVMTYLAIRRQWAGPVTVSVSSVIASVLTMALFSLAQGNSPIHAILVGVVVGTVFSGALLAIAWYFHSGELRAQYMREQMYQPDDSPAEDNYQ